jgi:hypothetical protein
MMFSGQSADSPWTICGQSSEIPLDISEKSENAVKCLKIKVLWHFDIFLSIG